MENKKENFKRITDKRVDKIIDTIDSFSNLTNTSFYEFDEQDIEEMFSKIQIELDKEKEKLIKFSKKPKKVRL